MRLETDEVAPGLVAWLDQAMLTDDARVTETARQSSTDIRPFVCFAAEGASSSWAPLTSQFRRERLEIQVPWRSGGLLPAWRSEPQYLVDGATVYIGANEAFLDASHGEQSTRTNRAQVSADAVAAIASEVARQEGRREVPVRPAEDAGA